MQILKHNAVKTVQKPQIWRLGSLHFNKENVKDSVFIVSFLFNFYYFLVEGSPKHLLASGLAK